jgi:hypothetical protein
LLTYNIVFTLLVAIITFPASISNAKGIFLSKIIGFLSAAALHYYLAKKTFFYFRNAGFSARRVILTAFIAESICCILILIIGNLVLNAIIDFKG